MTERETLSLLVHAESGAGKSWMAQTSPAPRLVLDAEGGGSRFARRVIDGKAVRIKRVEWDPHSEPPPAAGDWEACFVNVAKFDTLQRTFEWLNKGGHPFKSLVLDSLTEIQAVCKQSIRTGDEVMDTRMWGILLDRMTSVIKSFRDLRDHPTDPIETVVFLAIATEHSMKYVPMVQGQLRDKLPGWVDVIGYLTPTVLEDGSEERRMLIRPHDRYLAKDRTHVLKEHYGAVIVNPDIEEMLDVMNREDEV